jgi:uncharacterized protein (DUF1330 family)
LLIALPAILLTKDLAIRRTDTFDQMHVDVIDRERFDRRLADKSSRRTRTTSEVMDGRRFAPQPCGWEADDRPPESIRSLPMPAYGVAHLRSVAMGPAIVAYLEKIDATLKPFGGMFIVHGGRAEVLEGQWSGDLIVIEFPDRAHARAWYESAAYQEILPLRTDNAVGEVILVDGVSGDHRATDVLAG